MEWESRSKKNSMKLQITRQTNSEIEEVHRLRNAIANEIRKRRLLCNIIVDIWLSFDGIDFKCEFVLNSDWDNSIPLTIEIHINPLSANLLNVKTLFLCSRVNDSTIIPCAFAIQSGNKSLSIKSLYNFTDRILSDNKLVVNVIGPIISNSEQKCINYLLLIWIRSN